MEIDRLKVAVEDLIDKISAVFATKTQEARNGNQVRVRGRKSDEVQIQN
jgi:hypothetical protein